MAVNSKRGTAEAKRTYNPTSPELIKAIEGILAANPNAGSKEVYAELLKKEDFKLWKIPERRVAKFVKRTKSPRDEGDDVSVNSTGTMTSVRKYFAERKARKQAKKEARKSAKNGDGVDANDFDDDMSLSSTTSMSSVRKFFARDRSNARPTSRKSKRNTSATAGKPKGVEVQVVVSEKNWDQTVSPLKGAASPGSAQQQSAQKDMDDDDASVSSVSSIRKFFKDRKTRKQSKKNMSKKKQNIPGAVEFGATTTSTKPGVPGKGLLSPMKDQDDDSEPDLMKGMDHEKVANGKAQPGYSTPVQTKKKSIKSPLSSSTATTAASRDLADIYGDDTAKSQNVCAGCALWNPFAQKTGHQDLIK